MQLSVHGSTVHNSQDAEASQVSIDRGTNKEVVGLPWTLSGKEPACQCREHWFDP